MAAVGVAAHIVKLPPLTVSVAFCLSLSGCIVPYPSRSLRTPEISGRVVTATSRAPLPNSTLSFLQRDGHTALPKPTVSTDAFGRFHLPRSVTQHAVFLFGGVHNSAVWPDQPEAKFLRIQHFGYATKILDLDEAFKTSGLPRPQNHRNVHWWAYDGLVPLGDIAVKH